MESEWESSTTWRKSKIGVVSRVISLTPESQSEQSKRFYFFPIALLQLHRFLSSGHELSGSKAETEEQTNHKPQKWMSIVIGRFFRFCFRLRISVVFTRSKTTDRSRKGNRSSASDFVALFFTRSLLIATLTTTPSSLKSAFTDLYLSWQPTF